MTDYGKEFARDTAIMLGIGAAVVGCGWYFFGPPRFVGPAESKASAHSIVFLACSADGERWHRVGPSYGLQGFVAMARAEPGCRVLRMELDGDAPQAPSEAIPATSPQEAP